MLKVFNRALKDFTPVMKKKVDRKVVDVHMKDYQIVQSDVRPNVHIYPCQNVPSNVFSGSSKYYTKIEAGTFEIMNKLTVRINGTVSSNAAVLTNVFRFFEEIEFKTRKGSGEVIATITSDELVASLSMYDEWKRKAICKLWNVDDENMLRGSEVPAGGSFSFYLPIYTNFLVDGNLNVQHLNDDIQVSFKPYSDIRISGTGTVSISGMDLIFETQDWEEEHSKSILEHFGHAITEHKYLTFERTNFDNRTLTAGTEMKLNMNTLDGKYAGLYIFIRSTNASNSSDGLNNFINLGDEATSSPALIQFKDAANIPVYGPIHTNYLRHFIYPKHFDSTLGSLQNQYLLPFCDSMTAAFNGDMSHGYLQLHGETCYLSITPGSASTSEVHTLTPSSNPTAGNYKLCFMGEFTSTLAYNANAAAIKAALEALRTFQNYKGSVLTVTASGALSAGAVTLTFSPAISTQGHLVSCHPEALTSASGATLVTVDSSLTTRGIQGFTTGSYDVTVLAARFSSYEYDFNGNIGVKSV